MELRAVALVLTVVVAVRAVVGMVAVRLAVRADVGTAAERDLDTVVAPLRAVDVVLALRTDTLVAALPVGVAVRVATVRPTRADDAPTADVSDTDTTFCVVAPDDRGFGAWAANAAPMPHAHISANNEIR